MQNSPAVLPNIDPVNFPPEWATLEKDLLCPLCGYNLRGLTESRCPECGFQFTWQELIDADRNKHLFLFEYGKRRNIKTFWKTYLRTCRPRLFWREISPAQEVSVARLIGYYFLACSIFLIVMAATCTPYLKSIADVGYNTWQARNNFKPITGSPGFYRGTPAFVISLKQLNSEAPFPWQREFWRIVSRDIQYGPNSYSWEANHQTLVIGGWATVFMSWPFITLLSLMIFRLSMGQAKIKTVQLLRAVIYSCDFGLLTICMLLAFQFTDFTLHRGWQFVAMAAVCTLITTYRLAFAFKSYLRIHLPLETVIASQIIAFLFAFLMLIQIIDFSRQI